MTRRRHTVHIREDVEPVLRSRLVAFLKGWGVRAQIADRQGRALGHALDLADLTTEALDRLAQDEVRRFWARRRQDREFRRAA
ncbi:hypothetical protein [uncultured Enterovirga sp.]|uniref:hypothetical protein n=1 Tax=uncultured Enterovirga sp. TaxID=2026352 RepID=UPI0035CAF730